MAILEIKNVTYSYDKKKNVLNGMSGELASGKLYAILGASGSGKTTLLSLLGGLDVPTKGTILFNGEDILNKGLDYHRRYNVALIFQSYNLIDYMTPLENTHELDKCVVVVTHSNKVAKQADVVLHIKHGNLVFDNQ